jgi:glutamyl-tRNA synthetase
LPGGLDVQAKLSAERTARLAAAIPLVKPRAKTLVDLIDAAAFVLASRPLALDDAAAALLDDEARAMLARLSPRLSAIDDWTAPRIEDTVRQFADAERLKLGNVAQPLRAALTGHAASPGIFEVLVVLGREESLGRISDQASV